MVERPRTDPIEIDVVQLSYAPGRGVDRVATARRWWDALPAAATGQGARAGQAARAWPAPTAPTAATTVLTGNASFWRVVDVPGDELGRVLGAWWLRSQHDDGRLCLGEPRGADPTWELGGTLRMTSLSKRFAVDVRISSHARYWSLLELTPRRPIRPNRLYFRVGHDSLDRFVARLRALT